MNSILQTVGRFLPLSFAIACVAISFAAVHAAEPTPSTSGKASPTDWYHWRGPQQNGQSIETGLPTTFSPKGENLLWKKPEYATRSTPVVMNGRVYVVCRDKVDTNQEGEKTVCLDAVTGDLIWESVHNIYLTDVPPERIGWSSVVGDPATDRVYVLGLGVYYQCLDGKTGKAIWEHSMLEEYGMLSTYGGRTNFPIVFEDLVIISGVMTGWDQTAVPAHRFIAMDKSTGAPVWMFSTRVRPEDTTYSTPIMTVFNGQAAMVFGSSDGAVYALQPRTGKVIWKYQASPRGLNVSPLVEDGIVYMGHGEQNEADRSILGAIFAFNGNTTGEITEDELLWKVPAKTVSRSCPVKVGERVYFLDDAAALIGVNEKTGEVEVESKLGRSMFGSIVVAEGKLYVAETNGVFYCLEPTPTGLNELAKVRLNDRGEVFGSIAISNGKLYLPSTSALYCIGSKDAKPSTGTLPEVAKEAPLTDRDVAQIQLCPVELLMSPGQKVKLQVRAYNAAGRYLKNIEDAVVSADGGGEVGAGLVFTAPSTPNGQAVMLNVAVGELKSQARARVIPPLPWSYDFEDKKVPIHWIGMTYRHQPIELPSGGNGLVKVSTIPKGVRSQGFAGLPSMHDYTVQAEFYALDTKNKVPTKKLPDMGLVNQRYSFVLQGAQKIQIRSWLSLLEQRFAVTLPYEWQPNQWYVLKFQSENKDGKATLRGKIWKKGEPEPEAWTIEGTDATPNVTGSPGLAGDSTDAEFYIDNVSVTPNP